MAVDLEDDELEDQEDKKPKPQPQGSPQPQSIGTPIAPTTGVASGVSTAPPKFQDVSPIISQPQQQTPAVAPIMPDAPMNTGPVGQSAIGSPINPPAAPRPAGDRAAALAAQGPPEYHGFNKFLDILGRVTGPGRAIESMGGFGTLGYNSRLDKAETQAQAEEKQIEGGERERQANASLEETQARTAKENQATEASKAGMQNVMITLPDGRQISIPQSQLGADVRALITTQGAGQRNAATNASREGIAAENNQTKRDTTTQGIDAREKIAARADATKRELGMAKLALDRSKVAAGPKAPPEIAKAHATLEGSISRLNIMQENKQRALAGDQQAALSMLANHIGMTMGLVPGARINRQIYEEAEMSAPWLQRVEAHFDDQGYLTGVVLTPQQMDQMEDLAVNRLREDRRNLADTENYYGFHGNNAQPTGNTPPRPPGVPPEAQWNGKTWKMPTTNKP